MICPFCHTPETKVIDSRHVPETNEIRRRRSCPVCQQRFSTYETVEMVMPRVIKRDGSRISFDENKLRKGILCALERRPVTTADLDQAIANILKEVRAIGEKEVHARQIGELVMMELKKIDSVAYIRFSSVYREFKDLSEFQAQIDDLKNKF